MNRPEHYKAIVVWGNRLGSNASYIADEQLRAALDNAPEDALFPQLTHDGHRTGKWICISDLPAANATRQKIEESLNRSIQSQES